jgi:hypothetical protein
VSINRTASDILTSFRAAMDLMESWSAAEHLNTMRDVAMASRRRCAGCWQVTVAFWPVGIGSCLKATDGLRRAFCGGIFDHGTLALERNGVIEGGGQLHLCMGLPLCAFGRLPAWRGG